MSAPLVVVYTSWSSHLNDLIFQDDIVSMLKILWFSTMWDMIYDICYNLVAGHNDLYYGPKVSTRLQALCANHCASTWEWRASPFPHEFGKFQGCLSHLNPGSVQKRFLCVCRVPWTQQIRWHQLSLVSLFRTSFVSESRTFECHLLWPVLWTFNASTLKSCRVCHFV